MVRRPRTAGNPVPFQETSSPAGGFFRPTCPPSCSLALQDILSDREFLVDSGASVSVFSGPRLSSDDGVRLLTAHRSPMLCSGSCLIPLRFSCRSGSRVYTRNFQLAPVSIPLLGADFLQHFNLMVDIKGRKLVHADCPEDVIIQLLQVLNPPSSQCPSSPPRKQYRISYRSIPRPLIRRVFSLEATSQGSASSFNSTWSSSFRET